MINRHAASVEPESAQRTGPRRSLLATLALATAAILTVTAAPVTAAWAEEPEPTAVVAPADASITGSLVVGGTATVGTGAWTPAETVVSYTWWSAEQPYTAPVDGVDQNPTATQIADAATATLPLDSTLAGRYIWAVVTGSLDPLTPASVVAAAATPVGLGTLTGLNPTFSSTPRVDTPLTIVPGAWPEGTTFSYKWRLTDTNRVTTYPAVAGDTYSPPSSALGKKVSVIVTASLAGYTSVQRFSPMVVVTAAPFGSVAVPTIKGGAYIGATLTAVPGAASPSATYTYQWRRAGAPIAGATKATYKIVAADLGKVVSVTVTARRTGYVALARTAYTAAVTRPFAAVYAPTVTGSVRVGNVLTAKTRAWSPAATIAYQWRRNGVAIAGATKATYVLTTDDLGATISVAATGRRSGYYPRTVASASTIKVLPPITMTRDGLFVVGQQIAPGTYVAPGGNECYFERRSDDNVFEQVGTLGWQYFYGEAFGGQKVITITAGDTHFYTEGCGTWRPSAVALKTSVKDGTWVIGKDVSPGVWQAMGPFDDDGCYIAYHGGFSGDPDVDLLAEGFVEAVNDRYYVFASHKGFTTDGCGTWKRVSN